MDKGRTSTLLKLKYYTEFRMTIFFVIFLLIGACFVPLSSSQLVNQNPQPYPKAIDGQILYSPMFSTTTYLRENTGTINHTWPSSYFPGCMVRWLGDGTILRTIRVGVGPGGGGAGGGVQKVEWDGTVVWDFRYNTNGHLSHHDVRSLPNGNVLLIAWETKTRAETIAEGRNPSYVSNQGFMPDHIIEVQPTGPSSGTIVWEWHVWDHLIQDYDSSKANYGVVGDHPELVDINYVTSSQQDWMHTNSIDYNEEFDQILLSVHNFNEIWIIDHSTTTEEAAGHTGGNRGKGGDLLYRWGNPQAYDAGTSSNQKLFNQHDVTWIDEGCPGEGNILVFNNGGSRHYSTVDEIVPPVNDNGEYYLAPGSAYGPTAQTWIYSPQPSFYASHLSGAQRLASGNTLVCNGETGKIFEVTPEGATVWQYTGAGEVLKIDYIPPEEPEPPEENNTPDLDCSGSLSWTDIEPGATVIGSFQVQNIGDTGSLLNWTINTSSITWGTWSYTPESGENLSPGDGSVTVHVSVIAPNETNSDFEGYIRVENKDNPNDFDVIPVSLTTPVNIDAVQRTMFHQFLLHFLQRHLFIEKLWNLFSPGAVPLSH
ncbi:MAG: aryl-sulfate sulfotransferase [Thermoplasmata archaeon]|nr:aryl-sulfate sulfotransferase [Thermoplasmata archaeon]MBE3140617.1 aryl-sulfate sulfotransferase [Thermoplasmata archaeon]